MHQQEERHDVSGPSKDSADAFGSGGEQLPWEQQQQQQLLQQRQDGREVHEAGARPENAYAMEGEQQQQQQQQEGENVQAAQSQTGTTTTLLAHS